MTSGADMAANIAALRGFVGDAAAKGAQFLATPENTFLMEAPGAPRTLFTQEAHPGVAAAAEMAKQYGVWLLIGSVAIQDSGFRMQDSGKTYNRSLLFNPAGEVVAAYDKIHLFDVDIGDGQSYKESAKVMPGGKAVVAPLPAAIGMTICYDIRFPHLYRALAKAGAEIIAIPAAFTQTTGEAHWHVLNRVRAIENGCFVIAPAQTGTHPGGRKTFGHSLIIDPWGRVLADGGTAPGVVMAELDMAEVAKVRAKLPSLMHDRDYIF